MVRRRLACKSARRFHRHAVIKKLLPRPGAYLPPIHRKPSGDPLTDIILGVQDSHELPAPNRSEFWNVCTRPVEQNGYGLPIDEAKQRVEFIERTMTLLPDDDQVYSFWRQLVFANRVRGVQVHHIVRS